ncbi:MAG: sugar porter family MFS transporter [Opitutales bacterium]
MNKKLFLWSLTSALSGFLFGFDTVVISGAEQAFQEFWALSNVMHACVMTSALVGTIIGAVLGSWPSDKLGRKTTLLWIGVMYFISALGSGIAPDPYTLMIARFIGGVGIGISTVAGPLYISEMAPANMRGRLTGLYQFNLVFGILIAFVSNMLLNKFMGDASWRWMLGIEAIPAILYTVMCIKIPESPRWLILNKGDTAAGAAVLKQVNPEKSEAEITAMVSEIAASGGKKGEKHPFFTAELFKPIMLVFLLSAFNQLSGINAVLYYSKRIFEMGGFETEAALMASIGIGATNFIFTFIGLWMIDKFGRKTNLFIGSIGYITFLLLIAWSFSTDNETIKSIMPFFVFGFIGAHGVGQGAVIWVYISEIFPAHHRAHGTSFGVSVHWVFAAAITFIFPIVVNAFEPVYIFGFFAFMMVLQLIWVVTMVIETKGRSLEEMEQMLGIKSSAEGTAAVSAAQK